MEKVSRLGGTRRKEIIATIIVKFNSRKHTNEEIYENVDTLEHALINKKQASFYYFKLNENGEKVRIIRTGEHRCVAAVKGQESPTFWGWMFQFAGDMKILTPEDMVEKYKERARKIIE